MMDHERQEKDLQEVFEANQRAYRAVMQNTLALQERTLEFARNIFESSAEALRSQTESNRVTLETLTEQSNKQREAIEGLIREATEVYTEVLRTPFSHHHHHAGEDAVSGTRETGPPETRSTQ